MTGEFVPTKIIIADDYRKDDLTNAYADAAELGLWISEFGTGPTGIFICGVGSVYTIQQLEHEYPDKPEIDPWSLSIGDCMAVNGWPGSGDSRVEAIYNGIERFKNSDNWQYHEEWHNKAVDVEDV